MVHVHGHTDTHTHASPTTRSILSLTCFEIFPPLPSISKISAFVQTYLVEPRPHCLPLKKSEINNLVPSPLWLLQTNYQLSTNMPSEKQINKQKKNSNHGAITSGEATKAFICKGPELERFFFFFKWAKTHCSLGTERKPGAPGTRGHFPYLPGERKKLL